MNISFEAYESDMNRKILVFSITFAVLVYSIVIDFSEIFSGFIEIFERIYLGWSMVG